MDFFIRKGLIMKKILWISSQGGHLNELLQLEPLFSKYDSYFMTEKTVATQFLKEKYPQKTSYLLYGTRHNILLYPFILFANCFISLYHYLRFRPDYIISTGSHTAGPMCCIAKIMGSKVIYIETFANSENKTAAGRLIYLFADLFIVQWESMLKVYPKSKFGGWIFK